MQEEFKQTLTEALKTAVDEDEVVAEKGEDSEPTEETEEVEVEEEVEEEVEDEPAAEKGESKQEPVHDNLTAEKSKPMNIYEALGRNPDGTRKL
jgi:hypothetical protein